LKMGSIGRPEISLRNLHYSLCNSPEERSSLLLRGGSLKSRNYQNVRDKDIMIMTKLLLIQMMLLLLLLMMIIIMIVMMMALALFHREG